MSLFKRGGVYWANFYRDGVRHQQSTGTPNRRKAETIENKFKEDLNDEQFQVVKADPNITFGALAAHFTASGSVGKHHIYHLKFLLPYFTEIPALRITKSMADDFRQARRAYNPEIKDATVNRDLSVLRHILYWSVDEQLIAANPIARLKMARERRTRRQVLSIAEEHLLLPAAKGHLYAMVLMALDTGMRRGEVTSQLWEDIDFSRKLLFVTHSKTPEGESREIPLSQRLHSYLLEHRQSEGFVISYKDDAVRIVKRSWKTALKKAGLRHMRFHDLRHTFNTRLMEAGVLQEIRMALMGHSPGSKVHATYTHIELPVKRAAIESLERWVSNQQQQIQNQKKENTDASTETERSEIASGTSARGEAGAQTLEEEIASRGGHGTSRKAQGRNRRDRRGTQGQTEAAAEIRRGQEDLRDDVVKVIRQPGGAS